MKQALQVTLQVSTKCLEGIVTKNFSYWYEFFSGLHENMKTFHAKIDGRNLAEIDDRNLQFHESS